MVDRRQRLAGPARIGRGFVPADAAHRVVVLPGRIGALFPGGGPRPSGAVDQERHRLRERDRPAVLHERLLPPLRPAVPAVVQKALEVTIGDLVLVDPIVRQADLRQVIEPGDEQLKRLVRRRDPDHPGWRRSSRHEPEREAWGPERSRADVFGYVESGQFRLPVQQAARDGRVLDRRAAERPPWFVRAPVRPVRHLRPGRHRLECRRSRDRA